MDGGLRGVNQGGGRVTGRFTVPKRNNSPAMNEAAPFEAPMPPWPGGGARARGALDRQKL